MSSVKNKYRRLLASFKPDERVVINFLDKQDNVTNAVRYLIMKEVKENGYRNLNNIIPANLTEEYFNFDFTTFESNQDELPKHQSETLDNEISISTDESTLENIEVRDETENANTKISIKAPPDNCFLDPE